MSRQFFRAGVGAVITDGKGAVLALERSDVPGAWQFPQGGIDEGETPLEAVRREVFEETGIAPASLTLIHEVPEWLAYELPAESRRKKTGWGQTQRWFFFRYEGDPDDLDLPEGEFRAYRWTTLPELARETVAFRRPVYARLAETFAGLG